MGRISRYRPSAPLVIAAVALVVAMGGSAAAASFITSKQIKNGTIQLVDISKKARTKLRGARGPAGRPGEQGPKGDTGEKGADFTLNTTLPSGQTERGSWGVGGGTNDWAQDTITYRIPLAALISGSNAHFLAQGAPPTAQCPGPGQAAAGQLCVYSREGSGTSTFSAIYHHESNNGDSVSGSGRYGFLIYFSTTADKTYQSGDWAVTAP